MADIQPEITAFKSAVYGEDVRDSMVSLANKVNTEAASAYLNNEQVPYLVKHANFMWHVSSLYTEPSGTSSGGLYFRFYESWVRTPDSKKITFASIDYIEKVTSPLGVEDCLHIPHNYCFCYNLDTGQYEMTNYTEITPVQVILILESLTGLVEGGHAIPAWVREQLTNLNTKLEPLFSLNDSLTVGLYGQEFDTAKQAIFSQTLIEPYKNLYHGGCEPGWNSGEGATMMPKRMGFNQEKYFGWTGLCPINKDTIDDADAYIATIWNIDYPSLPRIYRTFYDENLNFISRTYNTCVAASVGYEGKRVVGTNFTKNGIPENAAYVNLFVYHSTSLTTSPRSQLVLLEEWATSEDLAHPYTSTDFFVRDMIESTGGVEKTRNINTSAIGPYYFSRGANTPGYRKKSTIEGNYIGTKDFVPVKPETYYTITYENVFAGQIYYAFFDENYQAIVYTGVLAGTSNTCLSPANAAYMLTFCYGTRIIHGPESTLQIEEGENATEYTEPYTFVDSTARHMILSMGQETDTRDYPEYWNSEMELSIRSIRDNMIGVGTNGDTFVFVTDTHWRNNAKKSPALIENILKKTGCDMVVNGGDNIQGHLTTLSGAADEILESVKAFVFPGYKCFGVMGNHDTNTNNNAGNPESYLSKTMQYSVINHQYGRNDLVYTELSSNTNSYYWDNVLIKIRYLFLDWSGTSASNTSFITNAMTTLPSGYKAVVVIHGIYANSATTEDGFVMERQYVVDAFEPYKDNVVFFIQGHTHHDGIKYPWENDPTPIIITRNDSLASGGHVSGTDTEQSFDVVTFDYVRNVIYITRVGEGDDREIDLTQQTVYNSITNEQPND